MDFQEIVAKIKTNAIIFAILSIIFGLILLLFPGSTSKILCYVLGAVLILCGVFCIVRYFLNRNAELLYNTDVFIGLVLIAIGIFIICKTELVISLLIYIVAVCVLLDGFFKIQKALQMRSRNYRNWWITLAAAVLIAAFGLFMLFYPFATAKAIVAVIGACLVYEGILNLWTIYCLSRIGRSDGGNISNE